MSALEQAKAYLRIAGDGEDAVIAGLIGTASALCEGFIGQVLIARTVTETMVAAEDWRRLRAAPVRAITAVEGIAGDGAAFALPVGGYAIDLDGAGTGWVRVTRNGGAVRVRVTAVAGLAADWDGVPEAIRQGVVRLTAHLFAHRDAGDDGGPPRAVAALWRPWRRMRLR